VLRDAATVAPGDTVHVTLARGELECEARSSEHSTQRTPRTQR
jgi:hypothetical protein